MSQDKALSRREFIKQAAAAGGATVAGASLAGSALANRHPHPHENSLDYLDRNTYVEKFETHGRFLLNPDNPAQGVSGKCNLMAVGDRRYLFKSGNVWDISDPENAEVINRGGFRGGQLQVAYNRNLRKWIMLTGASVPTTSAHPLAPNGKYDDPSLITTAVNAPGLRGIRMWDVTDPSDIKLLSEWSCDQGDPSRTIQTGGGTHRDYYDGGQVRLSGCRPG